MASVPNVVVKIEGAEALAEVVEKLERLIDAVERLDRANVSGVTRPADLRRLCDPETA